MSAATNAIESRSFSAQTIGLREARARAIRWQLGLPVPERYDGMDLSRVVSRRLLLTRRITNGPTPYPRFELEIPSCRVPGEPWMCIYLGTANTIDQERIDRAVATLNARLRCYRARIPRIGRKLAGQGLTVIQGTVESGGSRLLCSDVLSWNGRGKDITFNPAVTIDPLRREPYLPEMMDYFHAAISS